MNSTVKKFSKKLNSLRQEGSLCDVTLAVDGGKEFKAHRCVLAASSPYFCNLFTSDMREKTQMEISIEVLSGSVMEDLLSYLYTGAVKIEKESSVRDILCAADFLMVPRLKKLAGDFFLRNLAVSNCVGVHQLALVTNSEQLEVKAEDEIFEVVDSWVERNPESRREYLLRLLGHVRLTLVSQDYLDTKVLKNRRIRENQSCMDFVLKRVGATAKDEGNCLRETPRKCLHFAQCLLACGGHKLSISRDQSNLTCCFVPDQGKWYKLPNMLTGQSGHAVTTCQGQVYSVGGAVSDFPYDTSKVKRYDPASNLWAEAAPLPLNLMLLSVASVGGLMYVCGGIDNHLERYSKRVFEYNLTTNTWQERVPMIHGRSGLCTVACGQFLFAIGGYTTISGGGATNTVEKFNPSTNTWVQVSPMNENRTLLCAAAFQKAIYVFGGVRGGTAEMYDTEKDHWQRIPHMQVARASAGAATV